jgi:hypothetical protein
MNFAGGYRVSPRFSELSIVRSGNILQLPRDSDPERNRAPLPCVRSRKRSFFASPSLLIAIHSFSAQNTNAPLGTKVNQALNSASAVT